MKEKAVLDPNEAPEGFIAVLKHDARQGNEDVCNSCDWRNQCEDPNSKIDLPSHRCMATALNDPKTGRQIRRADGCSVVFKRKPVED